MTLQEFFNAYNGKKADYDGSFGAQCKDLFSFYNRDVVGNIGYVVGNANQLYNNCPAAFYQKITTPKKGDVATWNIGEFGHVAIVWDNGKFFSQNYPIGEPCSLQTIPNYLLIGYLRPLIKEEKPVYNNYIIRNRATGAFAYVKAGHKQQVTQANQGIAVLTFLDNVPGGIFPQERVVGVDAAVWNSIPDKQPPLFF